MIIIVTILIGTVTPPVGLQLYIASAIGGTRLHEVVIWPFVGAMILVVILKVLFAPLTTYLPHLSGLAGLTWCEQTATTDGWDLVTFLDDRDAPRYQQAQPQPVSAVERALYDRLLAEAGVRRPRAGDAEPAPPAVAARGWARPEAPHARQRAWPPAERQQVERQQVERQQVERRSRPQPQQWAENDADL